MESQKISKKSTFKEYLGAILLVLFVHIFVYQPYTIPSGSMMPTLLVGDYIFANKFAYGFSRYSVFFQPKFIRGRLTINSPKRGDVSVFFHPFKVKGEEKSYDHGMFGGALQRGWRFVRDSLGIPQEGVSYVKRVIGIPGDKIQMIGGYLHINGEKLALDYKGDYPMTEQGKIRNHKLYIETLPNGLKHPIFKIFDFGDGPLDRTEEFEVPKGHYFMMGDNRDNSCDSREKELVGFIPEKQFIGRPDIIFFSTEAKWFEVHKWFFDLRYKRLLNIVR